MLKRNTFSIAILLFTLCISCQQESKPSINETAERAKIMEQHDLQRTFHFDKLAEEFAAQLSENHISVNRGEIKTPTRQENTKRFEGYFNSVEFEKWDDIVPPIIRFSDDYSLAYTIVNKEVTLTYENENGGRQRETTEFAWVAIYKKYDGGWKIDCVASTNKPSSVSVVEE